MTPVLRAGLLAACFVLFCSSAYAQSAILADAPLSNRKVAYQIDARLNPDNRAIAGQQRLTWRNTSDDAIEELQFHLYLNAFRDENSTFMVESGGQHRGFSAGDEEFAWGGD